MQAALEVTLRYCHKETEQYGQCVAANPSSWQKECHQLKLDMAKCTSSQFSDTIRGNSIWLCGEVFESKMGSDVPLYVDIALVGSTLNETRGCTTVEGYCTTEGRDGICCVSDSPIVQKIRHDCAEPFTAFEQCLKTNQSSSIKCSEHLQKFLICADQVKLNP